VSIDSEKGRETRDARPFDPSPSGHLVYPSIEHYKQGIGATYKDRFWSRTAARRAIHDWLGKAWDRIFAILFVLAVLGTGIRGV
jgi:hypothetical protein